MTRRTPDAPASFAGRDRTSAKKKWVAPAMTRMAAGGAENGANPLLNDGAFTAS